MERRTHKWKRRIQLSEGGPNFWYRRAQTWGRRTPISGEGTHVGERVLCGRAHICMEGADLGEEITNLGEVDIHWKAGQRRSHRFVQTTVLLQMTNKYSSIRCPPLFIQLGTSLNGSKVVLKHLIIRHFHPCSSM